MDKQLALMEKTVVRGGDKAREFEHKTLVKVADHIKGECRSKFLHSTGIRLVVTPPLAVIGRKRILNIATMLVGFSNHISTPPCMFEKMAKNGRNRL